jgi:hypothetical protein
MTDTRTLRYADAPDGSAHVAQHVYTWKRGEIPALKMSTSSGEKDYLCNDIFHAFEARPECKLIAEFVLHRTPFLLFQIGGRWFDCGGREVVGI